MAERRLPLLQIDAFADVPFTGNPAAVCLLHRPANDEWMQQVASEMNLSETAFVRRRGEDGNEYDLRWFTPTVEVDLCGHATLAAAHALWETSWTLADEEVRFHTRSGVLAAHRNEAWIQLDFPAEPASEAPPPAGLSEALGVEILWSGCNRLDLLVEVTSEAEVRGLHPNITALADLGGRGVMVTARASTPGIDFVSRYFAPASGIDEDPVTGSAHCCLGPYWAPRIGRQVLTGFQASARGGTVRVELTGQRVLLSGKAVTVLVGELCLPPE